MSIAMAKVKDLFSHIRMSFLVKLPFNKFSQRFLKNKLFKQVQTLNEFWNRPLTSTQLSLALSINTCLRTNGSKSPNSSQLFQLF